MRGLTQKQENFARVFVETGNASEAYRQSYNCATWTNDSVNRKAHDQVHHVKVVARINELRAERAKANAITVDSLLIELDEARKIALGAPKPQSAAAVAATMGKAKLLGMDKQIVEMNASVQVTDISDEQLAEKLRDLGLGRYANQLVNKRAK